MSNLIKYHKDIQITVSVDTISEMLLACMDSENMHSVLVVNTIIGQAMANDRMHDLSRIYNSMNGVSQKINFELGQELFCEDAVYDYDSKIGRDSSRVIGYCNVVDINPLKDTTKIKIAYLHHNRPNRGELEEINQIWVSQESLRLLKDEEYPTVDREPEEKTGE